MESMLQELSKKTVEKMDQDLSVASGAALFSAIQVVLDAEKGDKRPVPRGARLVPTATVTRVSSFAVGHRTTDTSLGEPYQQFNDVLIPRNSTLPAQAIGHYSTVRDGQTSISITILEGESRDVGRCRELGRGTISGIPQGLPKDSPLTVTVSLNDEASIDVTAVETTYNTRVAFQIVRAGGLTDEEVNGKRYEVDRTDVLG